MFAFVQTAGREEWQKLEGRIRSIVNCKLHTDTSGV